jgi:hypothetical protein
VLGDVPDDGAVVVRGTPLADVSADRLAAML